MKKYYSFFLLLCVIAFVLAFKYMPNVDSHGFGLGKTKGDLRALESAVNLFKLDNGRVPSDTEGLWILVDTKKMSIYQIGKSTWIDYQKIIGAMNTYIK
jgi:hypothetical protein